MSANISPAIQALLDSLAVIPGVRWYHLADPSSHALDDLAAHFHIHPLQVEDCRHRHQTARFEEGDAYAFIVVKVLEHTTGERFSYVPGTPADTTTGTETVKSADRDHAHARGASRSNEGRLQFEDFDIFLGPDYVLTVSEGKCRLVPEVAPRIKAEAALQSPERIVHALVDFTVDRYLPALDHFGDFISRLEDRVVRQPQPPILREVFRLKRVLLDFRRVATAMREAVNGLIRRYDIASSNERFHADRELRIYYRDVYDHLVRAVDFTETYRDILAGSLDIYLSSVANRTNEVMKILTLWSTIALPLLVLTSFYGMNIPLPFEKNPHALIILGLIMVASTVTILIYIRRKHWL